MASPFANKRERVCGRKKCLKEMNKCESFVCFCYFLDFCFRFSGMMGGAGPGPGGAAQGGANEGQTAGQNEGQNQPPLNMQDIFGQYVATIPHVVVISLVEIPW